MDKLGSGDGGESLDLFVPLSNVARFSKPPFPAFNFDSLNWLLENW